MKQKILRPVINLRNNFRYIVLLIASIILLFIAKQSTHIRQPSTDLGINLVNALYSYDTLEELESNHSEVLSKIMPDYLVSRYSLQTNRNRIQYAYYGLDTNNICPIIHKTMPGYIEFSISINGQDDGVLRGIWYTEENNKISGISEATLYPFPTNKKEGEDNQK